MNAVGGLRALVREGETGLFINPEAEGTELELAGQLDRLAKDPELRRRLGEAGRLEARNHYDWERVAEQLERLYQAAEDHVARGRGKASR